MNGTAVKDDVVGAHRQAIHRQVDNLTHFVGRVFRKFDADKPIVIGESSKADCRCDVAIPLHDLG